MDELDSFKTGLLRDGYAVARGLMTSELADLRSAAARMHQDPVEPIEYEADLGYPGAPGSKSDAGGGTIRRFLDVIGRGAPWTTIAQHPAIVERLEQVLTAPLFVSRAHHNCLMTKQAGFSSKTLWHQDIRYWSFSERNLISVWIALGKETITNGALKVIPGTHQVRFPASAYDEKKFFMTESIVAHGLADRVRPVELDAGDVLFFHCRLLHAAGSNRTDKPKYSLVFTYRQGSDEALPNTRSSAFKDPQIAEKSHTG